MDTLFRAGLAEDVEQVALARLQGPACQLQVVIAEGNRLCLLPLVVKHVDCDLMQRGDMIGGDKENTFTVLIYQQIVAGV